MKSTDGMILWEPTTYIYNTALNVLGKGREIVSTFSRSLSSRQYLEEKLSTNWKELFCRKFDEVIQDNLDTYTTTLKERTTERIFTVKNAIVICPQKAIRHRFLDTNSTCTRTEDKVCASI